MVAPIPDKRTGGGAGLGEDVVEVSLGQGEGEVPRDIEGGGEAS